jgi:alkanesulfonate monooxygenase SsuD/methylene tetrahydromethanopterin reductase-like flavin-dependent oxidoreductase (luciferase family)
VSYPNYGKLLQGLKESSYRTQVENNAVLVGSPETIARRLRAFAHAVGGFEVASLQINFHVLSEPDAERSMRLFAQQVMPLFR